MSPDSLPDSQHLATWMPGTCSSANRAEYVSECVSRANKHTYQVTLDCQRLSCCFEPICAAAEIHPQPPSAFCLHASCMAVTVTHQCLGVRTVGFTEHNSLTQGGIHTTPVIQNPTLIFYANRTANRRPLATVLISACAFGGLGKTIHSRFARCTWQGRLACAFGECLTFEALKAFCHGIECPIEMPKVKHASTLLCQDAF